MKKIIVFLLLACCCHAKQAEYFRYGGVHMMAGYPMLGVGLRTQKGIHGADLLGSVLPYFNRISDLSYHIRGLYLYHPAASKFYLGAGLGLLHEPENMVGLASGSYEGAVGFEWRLRNGNAVFLEANAISPFRKVKHRDAHQIWPGATFGFGF